MEVAKNIMDFRIGVIPGDLRKLQPSSADAVPRRKVDDDALLRDGGDRGRGRALRDRDVAVRRDLLSLLSQAWEGGFCRNINIEL